MAGFLPTRTTVELSTRDGAKAMLPCATAQAAGCMTAEHVRELEALLQWRAGVERGAPAPAAAAPDTSHLARRQEVTAIAERVGRLEQAPRGVELPPEVAALMTEMAGTIARQGSEIASLARRVAELESTMSKLAAAYQGRAA